MTLPRETLAVLVHLVVRSDHATRVAHESAARVARTVADAGISLGAVRGAVALLEADAASLEAQHLAASAILLAIRAPGLELEAVEVVERIADEDADQALNRATRAGYCAAALNRACDGGDTLSGSPAHRAWLDGFKVFRRDLQRYETAARRQAVAA